MSEWLYGLMDDKERGIMNNKDEYARYFTFTDTGISKVDLDLIRTEDACQRIERGDQTHTPDRWMLILSEEMGELSKAVLEAHYDGDLEDVYCEAVQCATLCLKIAVMAREQKAKSG